VEPWSSSVPHGGGPVASGPLVTRPWVERHQVRAVGVGPRGRSASTRLSATIAAWSPGTPERAEHPFELGGAEVRLADEA